jgi:hypothetical protein
MFVACLAPSANVSAAATLRARTMDGETLQQAQNPQYHSGTSGQYHFSAARMRGVSAWNLGSSRPEVEFKNPNAAGVISPAFTFYSGISNANAQQDVLFSIFGRLFGARNDRSIGNRIGPSTCSLARCSATVEMLTGAGRYQHSAPSSPNPRLMLQIGAILGLLYLVFLAVWIWATRFRMRPSRGAGT